MGKMLNLLKEGDRRTVGRVADAVRLATGNLAYLDELVDLLTHANPAVRMRASDALEKATAQTPNTLLPHKEFLLELAEAAGQNEVRWHLAQTLTRMELETDEIFDLADLFGRWFRKADSRIVRTTALQGMFDLAHLDNSLAGDALKMLKAAAKSGVPALEARARKLKGPLERLKANSKGQKA